jgi:hypothetical protein
MKNIYIGLSMASMACTNHPSGKVLSEKEVLDSKTKVEMKTTQFEGRFVKFRKVNTRDFMLFLRDSVDNLDSFRTGMPLDKNEIALLTKKGNNIMLRYYDFFNPVTKTTERVVRSMTPVYEFPKK